ncbi:hypothetical protein [Rosenbergiella epipactidis]|uniref:hypothetical protein n=1 Tax=Rosenbergiella epipactidis TaxID=1544694 RepID=UPI001F4E057B|nr:hypothetical protein [Rosenbergiella epipactidis]
MGKRINLSVDIDIITVRDFLENRLGGSSDVSLEIFKDRFKDDFISYVIEHNRMTFKFGEGTTSTLMGFVQEIKEQDREDYLKDDDE